MIFASSKFYKIYSSVGCKVNTCRIPLFLGIIAKDQYDYSKVNYEE